MPATTPIDAFLSALFLQAGFNTTLVSIGAAILGASAGAIGTFVLLRRRALVSDAISHATLPGLAAAFIVMALWFGNGRWMPGLLIGSALSAGLGILAVEWITRRTRLTEDTAIGAVLSVFFGFGTVLVTVIQSLSTGGQAGITGFLIGSTAGMLRSEAELIAITSAVIGGVVFLLRRHFTLVCFDQEYAATRGIDVRLVDLAMMGLTLAVTVIGLKVAGLVLIVALLIIPAVAARFWTNRPERMVLIAAGIGALSAYLGAVVSSTGPGLPTGALIVLVAFAFFTVSLIFSPVRGLLSGTIERVVLSRRVHERQGLLALARGEPIHDPLTRRVLRRRGFLRADGVATDTGRGAAAAAQLDEALWTLYRRRFPEEAATETHQGLVPIADSVPPDLLSGLRAELRPREA